MRRTLPFLFALLLADSARADCDSNPLLSTFQIVTTCSYDTPCAEDQPLQLTVKPDTLCYPRWAPCAPFPFEACDRVEWDFGDGTKATGHGTAGITHTWKNPGSYMVEGTVINGRGSKGFGAPIIIARQPIVRVHFSTSLYEANETDADVTLFVEREGDTSRAVTVLFTAGIGAASGEAWDRNIEHIVDREVTIPAGVTAVPVTVKIRDDDIYRGEQRYDAFLRDESGETVMEVAQFATRTEVRVVDNETGPTLAVSDITVKEGDAGRRIVKIPHVLSAPLADSLLLWWEIAGGTAVQGSDWDTPKGNLYFAMQEIPAGATRAELELEIVGDQQSEGDETIVLTLQKPYGPAVAFTQPQITITIEEDDLYRLTSDETESHVGTPFAMRVATTRPSPTPITATLQSSDPSIVTVPPSVTIPANANDVAFEAQALRAGDATITATFADDESVGVELLVIQQTALEFAREATRLAVNGESQVTLAVTPAAPMVVSLRATPADVIDLPPLVELDADGQGTFLIRGLRPGVATIIAKLPAQYGSTSEHLPVTVEQILTPSIATVIPSFGATGARVTIGGSDFSAGCFVLFGDTPATTAWKDEETLTATAPPHASGTVDVSVRCGDVTTTLPNAFTYLVTKRRAVR